MDNTNAETTWKLQGLKEHSEICQTLFKHCIRWTHLYTTLTVPLLCSDARNTMNFRVPKGGKLINQLNDYQLYKKHSTPWGTLYWLLITVGGKVTLIGALSQSPCNPVALEDNWSVSKTRVPINVFPVREPKCTPHLIHCGGGKRPFITE